MTNDKSKYKNKYRIESTRLKDYNYSAEGIYFITICTKNKEHLFGEIVDCEMKLSEIGNMVKNEWLKTSEIRNNVKLDYWIIMPNHVHLIVIINSTTTPVETHCNASLQQTCHDEQTHCNASVHRTYCDNKTQPYKNSFGPQSNNLSAIIRGFKGLATKNIHIAGFSEFAWQARFYDRIIRDEDELNRIRKYIMQNPINWENDRNNIESIYM